VAAVAAVAAAVVMIHRQLIVAQITGSLEMEVMMIVEVEEAVEEAFRLVIPVRAEEIQTLDLGILMALDLALRLEVL
jgi:hypothetical protein